MSCSKNFDRGWAEIASFWRKSVQKRKVATAQRRWMPKSYLFIMGITLRCYTQCRLRRSVKVPLTFEAGNKVMLYVKRKDQHKRSVRWDDPWTVSGLVNQPDDPNQFPLVYKICKFGQGGEVIATALGHINKLKPYHERA
jgi:hypothetical protein